MIAPEVEGEFFFGLGTYRGREGIRDAWEAWREAFPDARLDVEEIIECGGGDVVCVVHARGRALSSGVEIDQPAAGIWTIRDGMAIRGQAYATRAEALEAVGLRE